MFNFPLDCCSEFLYTLKPFNIKFFFILGNTQYLMLYNYIYYTKISYTLVFMNLYSFFFLKKNTIDPDQLASDEAI